MRSLAAILLLLFRCDATSTPPAATIPMPSSQALPSVSPAIRDDGVVGQYEIDKEAFRRALEEVIATSVPDAQKETMRLSTELIEKMSVHLELRRDGTWSMTSSFDADSEVPATKSGRWERSGETVVLGADGKNMYCTALKTTLLCRDKQGDKQPSVYFKRGTP